MSIRSKYDFKLSGIIMSKEEWSNIVLFTKATVVIIFMTGVKILSFLTRFFPFSLIGYSRSFHYRHRRMRYLMQVVQDVTEKHGKKFLIDAGEKDSYFYSIKGYFAKSNKRVRGPVLIKAIEKQLNLPEDSVFIRKWKGRKFRFLIPVEASDQN